MAAPPCKLLPPVPIPISRLGTTFQLEPFNCSISVSKEKQQPLGSETSVTAVLHMVPPSVDLSSKNVAWVLPHSPTSPERAGRAMSPPRRSKTRDVPSPVTLPSPWCNHSSYYSVAERFGDREGKD